MIQDVGTSGAGKPVSSLILTVLMWLSLPTVMVAGEPPARTPTLNSRSATTTVGPVAISGMVTVNSTPVPGVLIRYESSETITDSSGLFELTVQSDVVSVSVAPTQNGLRFPTPRIAGSPQTLAAQSPLQFEAERLVDPLAICRAQSGGQFIACFGYENRDSSEVTVEIGPLNSVTSPWSVEIAPPTNFLPGRESCAYAPSVPYSSESEVTWTLLGAEAKADINLPICDSSDLCPDGEQRDSCGVCGGNGTGCRECITHDIAALERDILSYIDSVSKKVLDKVLAHLTHSIRQGVRTSLSRTNITTLLATHARVRRLVRATFDAIDDTLYSCEVTTGCTSVSTATTKAELERQIDVLHRSVRSIRGLALSRFLDRRRLKIIMNALPDDHEECT